jgi:DNA-binding transcriptional ArsR family regulator
MGDTETALDRLIKSGLCTCDDTDQHYEELRRLAEETASLKEARDKSRLFKALSDEIRVRMVRLLGVRDMCVCEMIAALGLTQPTASHHLKILEGAGVVEGRKEGKWVFYGLREPGMVAKLRELGIL